MDQDRVWQISTRREFHNCGTTNESALFLVPMQLISCVDWIERSQINPDQFLFTPWQAGMQAQGADVSWRDGAGHLDMVRYNDSTMQHHQSAYINIRTHKRTQQSQGTYFQPEA